MISSLLEYPNIFFILLLCEPLIFSTSIEENEAKPRAHSTSFWSFTKIWSPLQKIKIDMTLVIRLAGTNVDEGNQILKESKINYIEASTLEDAANKAVEALKKIGN